MLFIVKIKVTLKIEVFNHFFPLSGNSFVKMMISETATFLMTGMMLVRTLSLIISLYYNYMDKLLFILFLFKYSLFPPYS